MSIPLQELHTPKTISDDKSLPFVTTYNPNIPNFCEMLENSVECLKQNKVDSFDNQSIMKSKQQLPKASWKASWIFKCPGKR